MKSFCLRRLQVAAVICGLTFVVAGCGDTTDDGGEPDVTAPDAAPDASPDTTQTPDAADDTAAPDVPDVETPDVPADIGADEVSAPDVPVAQDAGADVPPNGYTAAGLLLRITAPRGDGRSDATGSVATIGGLLFGEADSIAWASGSQSGAVALSPYWQTGPIQLAPGDNRITVTASRGALSVSDSITVTYNPAFRFDDVLLARPNALWVGQSTRISFTIPLSLYSTADRSTVRLLRVDASGNQIALAGPMIDDGGTGSSGDEIEADGVFTFRGNFTCDDGSPLYFRAAVDIDGTINYTGVSPTVRVDCVEHITTGICNDHKTVIDSAAAALASGTPLADVVTQLQGEDSVKSAGAAEEGGFSAWVQFNDGVLGAVLGTPDGKRGAGDGGNGSGAIPIPSVATTSLALLEIGSKRAIVLAPFASEFAGTDDGVDVANAIVNSECPSYELVGGTVLQGGSASLARFRTLSTFGVASISSHGEALFGGVSTDDMRDLYRWAHMGPQEVLWTGSPVNCGQLLQGNQTCEVTNTNPTGGCPAGTRCLVTEGTVSETEASGSGICADETQVDLRLGRAVLTNRGYAVTPSFFGAYKGRGYPNSYINLGACRTMYNGSFASELYAAGARAISGFSDHVESAWARQKVVSLFDNIGAATLLGNWFQPGEDPDNTGASWRLFGAGNLNLSNAEIINANFETGDTAGWNRTGDGRVVTQLGATTPVEGKFMGLVSTGLGFTVETGTLEQTFCIPDDKVQMEIFWKFYSEEFKEFCGSQYQDTLQTELVGGGGKLTVIDHKVDDLCGYEDGSCGSCGNPNPCSPECIGSGGCELVDGACVGSYNCDCGKYFVGLVPSDISFDQGGVFNVNWQRTVKNVQALAGTGPVTLRVFATDTGDSIYDTAILIDKIVFK